MTGNGTRPGANAFTASASNTIESLPPENSSTGFSSSAATSRMMWIASASRTSRCDTRPVTSVMSDRALALAADDLERHLAVPVDELAHRLQAELDRHGEVADGLLEVRRPHALRVGVEDLTILAAGLVVA